MNEETDDIEILMARVFAGEANEAEIATLDAWRAEDAANEKTFQQSKKLMESLSGAQFSPQVDLAWTKLEGRISKEHTAKVVSLFSTRSVIRAAAAIIVLIAGAWLFNQYRTGPDEPMTLIAATGVPVEQKLPDGSTVKVASHSKLEFSRDKNGQRRAYLSGEAFFEVVHNEQEPFVVSTGEVFIKDIGTAFNIRTLAGSGNTDVFVETGEVQFYTNNSQGIRLKAGEHGVYDKQSGVFTKTLLEGVKHLNSFRTRSFTFNENTLEDVLEQVNLVYGSHLVAGDPLLNNCRLSVTFNNEPLEVVVDVITQTLDLHTRQSGDTLILTGNGCN
jgi:transmembrane sensor